MSRWRLAFDRIGGPDAVTWPAFWVTYILSLLGHFAMGGATSVELGVRLLIVSITQVAVFVPLVVLRATLLRDPPRPRPWIALSGFVCAAVVRGAVLSEFMVATGAESMLLYRILASVVGVAAPLLVMALTVSAMRDHTRSLEALVGIRQDLLQAESQTVAEFNERNEQALSRVRELLKAELTALDAAQGDESVEGLHRLASDVIRPLSHELAAWTPTSAIPDSRLTGARITWRQASAQMIDRPPLRPGLAALFLAVILANAAIWSFGLRRGLLLAGTMLVATFVLSIAANRMLALALPRLPASTAPLLVLLASMAVGYVGTAASSMFLPDTQGRLAYLLAGSIYAGMIVALTAMVTTILRQQQVSERELIESTQVLSRQLVRLRQAQWLQSQTLARALHGPMQAAVTSAALRLDSALRAGQPLRPLLADTRMQLMLAVDVLEAPDPSEFSFALTLARISGTWEGVCHVTSQVEDCAAKRLVEDFTASAVIADLMTEAVSNAVRHGGARRVAITITCEGDDVVILEVSDDGQGVPESTGRGLGTAVLEECTLHWHRDASPVGCILIAALPVGVGARSSPRSGLN